MWSSDRRRLILGLAALPLAGCGFTPALAPGAPAHALRGRIRADDPADRPGVAFVARLEDRLGAPEAPGWRLGWTLTPEGAETPVLQGRTQAFAGYDRTGTPLAIRAAAEDARTRVAEMLAEALATELIATAGDLS